LNPPALFFSIGGDQDADQHDHIGQLSSEMKSLVGHKPKLAFAFSGTNQAVQTKLRGAEDCTSQDDPDSAGLDE
jgi:hypothetical protein